MKLFFPKSNISLKFVDNFLSKKWLCVGTLLLLFFTFFTQIQNWYDDIVTNPLLSKVRPALYLDLIFIILAIINSLIAVRIVEKKKLFNKGFVFCATTIVLLLLWFRIFDDSYNYTKLTVVQTVAYLDILTFIAATVTILGFLSLSYNQDLPQYNSIPFLIDTPIKDKKDDLYERAEFAIKIANKIQSKILIDTAGAFAIGINGKWGSGKTSFANLIHQNINQENRITIFFNPWRSSSSSKIIEDFFTLLINSIKPYNPDLSNNISDYAQSLSSVADNTITKVAKLASDIIFGIRSKEEIYDEINTSLEKINKQIIIFIDDLDRLDTKEIIEVLRIIRNTANFNNLVYVVTYDRSYITEAIKGINQYNTDSYLEKIFQIEFGLPTFDNGILRKMIKAQLHEKLPVIFKETIEDIVDYRSESGVLFTAEFIHTHRDVIRFCNLFIIDIENIIHEIFIHDFFLLELLKLKVPILHSDVFRLKDIFFILDFENNKKQQSVLRLRKWSELDRSTDELTLSAIFNTSEPKHEPNPNSDRPKDNTLLYDYIQTLSLDEYTKLIIYRVILLLFKSGKFKDENPPSNFYKSILYPRNFHKYFSYQILSSEVRFADFDLARKSDFQIYKLNIDKWLEEGKISEIIDKLEEVSYFDNVIEYENHVKALTYITKRRIDEGSTNYFLDYRKIANVLLLPLKNGNEFYNSTNDFTHFLHNYFNNAPTPPIFESKLIEELMNSNVDNFKKEPLAEINLKYFHNYCKKHKRIDRTFWSLYHSNNYNLFPDIKLKVDRICRIMLLRYLTACELGTFIKQLEPESDYYQLDKEQVEFCFDNFDDFEKWLTTASNLKNSIKCLMEILDYLAKYKDNNSNPIVFDFKNLTPIRWRTMQ